MFSEKLCFTTSGKFKIMQIADIQELSEISPDTLRLITLAVKKEKPDLVVLTGDQIYGIHPSFYKKDRKTAAEKTIRTIASVFNDNHIPFAVTYGNHDNQAGLSNKQMAEIYDSFDFSVHPSSASENDPGTFRIPLYDKDKHVFDIYLFDSNGQTPSGEYLPVKAEQLDWFKNERESAKEDGKYTNGIVFQHIPVPEFYNVLTKTRFMQKGAVEAFRTHKGEFYVLPQEAVNNGGFMRESPAVPDKNSGEFEVLKEKGNILALIVGHDHINSFDIPFEGIRLIYTQCAGFNVYGPKLERGVRIINLDCNDLSTFETHTLTYHELTDEKLSAPVKEFVLTHIPTSMEQVKRLAVIAFTMGTAAAIPVVNYFIKKYKQ